MQMHASYNFEDWGWQIIDENLETIWLIIPLVSKSCSELVRCGCKRNCRGRFKCKNSGLCIQNCVLAMEIANMLYIWLGGKKIFIYFLKFFGLIFSN